MKIRYKLAAIFSAVTLTGVAGLASAGAASAATGLPWCLNHTGTCFLSNGSGSPIGLTTGHPTNFASEDGETLNGHTYVLYYQIGTNSCLTDSGANVYLQTCDTSSTRQRWWYNGASDQLVNNYATVHYGHYDCATRNSGSGDAVTVADCTSNNSNQEWVTVSS